MKALRTGHIYGSVMIKSQDCLVCKADAFVIDGKMSCCGLLVGECNPDKIRIEVDMVGAKRRRVSVYERERILLEQAHCCFYCGDKFGSYRTLEGNRKLVKLHWDHVVPFCFNGNNHEFVASCAECNQAKHAKYFPTMQETKTHLALLIHEKKTATS